MSRYDRMKGDDLRAELKRRGLPTAGKVDELRARLALNDTAAAVPPATESSPRHPVRYRSGFRER